MTSPSEIDVLGLLWMLQLDRPRPCKRESRIPATFQRAGPEHATELAQAMGFDHPASVLQRLSMGKHCYIVRVKGKLAGYGWITYDTEDIGEFGVSIRLNEGEAYIWDCATLPAYRGQRLYPALLTHMFGELQCAGFRQVWIGTTRDNLPSQWGIARVGCQPIVEIILCQDGRYATRSLSGVHYKALHYTPCLSEVCNATPSLHSH